MDGAETRSRFDGEKFMSSGDLGLGNGLKPGGISIDHTNIRDDNSNSDSNTTAETEVPCEELQSADSSFSLLNGESFPVGELDYIGPISEKNRRFVNLVFIREKLSNAFNHRLKLRLRHQRASSTTGETPRDQWVKSFRKMLKRRDNRQGRNFPPFSVHICISYSPW